jgi:hypothetical protein
VGDSVDEEGEDLATHPIEGIVHPPFGLILHGSDVETVVRECRVEEREWKLVPLLGIRESGRLRRDLAAGCPEFSELGCVEL